MTRREEDGILSSAQDERKMLGTFLGLGLKVRKTQEGGVELCFLFLSF